MMVHRSEKAWAMPAKPADGRCGTHAILCLGLLLLAGGSVAGSDDSFFESKIRPVLAGTCLRCHGGQKVSGKLRLDSRESLLKGGASGPAVVPGNPDGSLLISDDWAGRIFRLRATG